jgi:hypothetical protein
LPGARSSALATCAEGRSIERSPTAAAVFKQHHNGE